MPKPHPGDWARRALRGLIDVDCLEAFRGASLGIAVSGGSDSMALMHLAGRWRGARLRVASVNHGLRPEANEEITTVKAQAATIDLPHDTLLVDNDPPETGNLQAWAREERYKLLCDWGRAHKLDAILLGHTLNDQAETLLLRLGRGSGVDGLAAMETQSYRDGMTWLRPMLCAEREDLRVFLRDKDVPWCEDPSNADDRFDRVRLRRLLPELEELGITAARLAHTAEHMSRAKRALVGTSEKILAAIGDEYFGIETVIERNRFIGLEIEYQSRILASVLSRFGDNQYRPRYASLARLLAEIKREESGSETLHNTLITWNHSAISIVAEARNPIEDVHLDGVWQGWHLDHAGAQTGENENWTFGALANDAGEVAHLWQEIGMTKQGAMRLPAVKSAGALVAVPHLNFGDPQFHVYAANTEDQE